MQRPFGRLADRLCCSLIKCSAAKAGWVAQTQEHRIYIRFLLLYEAFATTAYTVCIPLPQRRAVQSGSDLFAVGARVIYQHRKTRKRFPVAVEL